MNQTPTIAAILCLLAAGCAPGSATNALGYDTETCSDWSDIAIANCGTNDFFEFTCPGFDAIFSTNNPMPPPAGCVETANNRNACFRDHYAISCEEDGLPDDCLAAEIALYDCLAVHCHCDEPTGCLDTFCEEVDF